MKVSKLAPPTGMPKIFTITITLLRWRIYFQIDLQKKPAASGENTGQYL